MSKRKAEEQGDSAPAKKSRPSPDDGDDERNEPSRSRASNVTSLDQLEQLLQFQQDPAILLNKLKTVRPFLNAVASPALDEETGKVAATLLQKYLASELAKYERQSSRDPESKAVFLSDVFQTWHLASNHSDERLLATSSRVLYLFLRCISNSFELSRYGKPFCKSLLQRANLRIATRGMSNIKNSISGPCLLLMTELVTFDGGQFARQVFSERDRERTFDAISLARKLSFAPRRSDDGEDSKQPSIRADAIRYILANLKFQQREEQIEILKMGNVVRQLFDHLVYDAPEIAAEVLDTIRDSVLRNKKIPRPSKTFMLTDRVLSNVAKLYRVEEALLANARNLQVIAHQFLMLACTSPQHGTLKHSDGWYYSRQKDGEDADDTKETPVRSADTTHSEIQPRNIKLSSFIQTLKPWVGSQEQDLALSIFRAAPELQADYFAKKATFLFDPKLTATWIGYASFIFSAIALPVPAFFGRRGSYARNPPAVSVVLENILPSALNQQALTRCLNQSVELITFFVIRLLVVALEKLSEVLRMFEEAKASGDASQWDDAGRSLVYEFCQRCPKMKDIVTTFYKTGDDRKMEREAVTRLLALYYRVLPGVALEEKFDVSKPLTAALSATQVEDAADRETRLIELGSLLEVARWSMTVNWWQKPESLNLSPFTTLLKIAATSSSPSTQLYSLLASVAHDNGILQSNSDIRSLDALIGSVALAEDGALEFFDECVGRFVKRPVKYSDDLEELLRANPTKISARVIAPISLIWMTFVEQWPHAAKLPQEKQRAVARFLMNFEFMARAAGEDHALMNEIEQNKLMKVEEEGLRQAASKAYTEATQAGRLNLPEYTRGSSPETVDSDEAPTVETGAPQVDYTFPKIDDENHPALTRWIHKDIDVVVADGDLARLISYLSSAHSHIRRETLSNLHKVVAKVEASTHPDRFPVALLLGEVAETAASIISDRPLPYTASAFATLALIVLLDPTHFLYVKMNNYLNRGPTWNIFRLPAHWVASCLLDEPTEDDGHHKEVHWLVDYLIAALVLPEDLEIFRKCKIFERICTLYERRSSSRQLRAKILRCLWRATDIEGGSTTLITRFAILGWLDVEKKAAGPHLAEIGELEERLLRTCDRERVGKWSHGSIDGTIKGSATIPIRDVTVST